jgi:hypothetical protein
MALRLVRNHSDDRPEAEEALARWQGSDSVFFHKTQVKLGTILMNFGRTDHNSFWRVTGIKSYKVASTGRILTSNVNTVQKLNDDILITRQDSNETRQLSFATLSYSAIWRIVST